MRDVTYLKWKWDEVMSSDHWQCNSVGFYAGLLVGPTFQGSQGKYEQWQPGKQIWEWPNWMCEKLRNGMEQFAFNLAPPSYEGENPSRHLVVMSANKCYSLVNFTSCEILYRPGIRTTRPREWSYSRQWASEQCTHFRWLSSNLT